MCLSSVYMLNDNQDKELLCKNISSVLAEGNKLTFTNLLGIPTTVTGEMSKIDLVENCIYVRPTKE